MTNGFDIALLHRTLRVPSARVDGTRAEEVRESFSIDFVVDGVPMSHLLNRLDAVGMFMHRRHRFFGRGAHNTKLQAAYTDVSDLPKRLNLYSICYCGDPWCGAVTCEVWRSDSTIFWANIGEECGYVEGRKLFSAIGVFEFDAEQYADVIDRAVRGET